MGAEILRPYYERWWSYDRVVGRMLIILGAILIVAGLLFTLGERLPGDIVIRGKNSVFYFPWVTSLLISLLLTALFWLFGRR